MRHLLPSIVEELLQENTSLRAEIAKEEDRIRREARISTVDNFFCKAGFLKEADWSGSFRSNGYFVRDIILKNVKVLALVLEGEEDFKAFVNDWWNAQLAYAMDMPSITRRDEWRALAEAMKLDVHEIQDLWRAEFLPLP